MLVQQNRVARREMLAIPIYDLSVDCGGAIVSRAKRVGKIEDRITFRRLIQNRAAHARQGLAARADA